MRNVLLFVTFLTGCTSYIRDIPTFPEVKILRFYMPSHGLSGETLEWAIFANTCTDCVRVTTYSNVDLLRNSPLLVQSGKFNHEINPSSGLYSDWSALIPGRYLLDVEIWNRWTTDHTVHFVNIETKDMYQGWE